MTGQPDSGINFDNLLRGLLENETQQIKALTEEEDILMFQIFGDSYAALEGMAFWCPHLIEEWGDWPEKKKEILKRCDLRGLIRVELTKPSETAFQLWVEVARILYFGSPPPEEELRKEFFQDFKPLPLVYVTIEGAKLIADLAEAK